MDVKFTQDTSYGCGLYAVANAINDNKIITNERLEHSKNGNNIIQLNKWLIEDGYDFQIDYLYFNILPELMQLPPKDMGFTPKSENQCFPFLLDVCHNTNPDTKKHLIGCYSDVNGNVCIMDSLKKESFITKWEHLISGAYYNVIIGIYGFAPIVSDGNWKMLECI